MEFFYGTVFGRLLLKLLLGKRVRIMLTRFLQSPYSKWMIAPAVKKYHIDMAPFPDQSYGSYAEFFSRKKECGRFTMDAGSLISPCDGLLSAVYPDEDARFPVKGIPYSLYDLVLDETVADAFIRGLCLIFRLRPSDYHRFCCIDDCYHGKGTLLPGELHSVQPIALEKKPVFRRNRRMWSILDTENFGKVVQIEVGAVLVGGIVLESEEQHIRRGDEMGYFELCGSTIILLLQEQIKEKLVFSKEIRHILRHGGEYEVKMGEVIGRLGRP